MIQPAIFDVSAVPTIASPLCSYENCTRKGRAILGPVVRVSEDCEHQEIECLDCPARGHFSRNLRGKQ